MPSRIELNGRRVAFCRMWVWRGNDGSSMNVICELQFNCGEEVVREMQ